MVNALCGRFLFIVNEKERQLLQFCGILVKPVNAALAGILNQGVRVFRVFQEKILHIPMYFLETDSLEEVVGSIKHMSCYLLHAQSFISCFLQCLQYCFVVGQ